jgi:outer membrane protein OmpA-like peptidoglycan-associated protein
MGFRTRALVALAMLAASCQAGELTATDRAAATTPVDADTAAAPPATGCTTNMDCHDGGACTIGVCAPGSGGGLTCQYFPIPNCCTSNSQCTDSIPCTTDECLPLTHTCVHLPISNCCIDNAMCMDGERCTTNTCDTASNTCVHTAIPNCCTSDMDCDDHDACTTDTCDTDTGTCSNTAIPNCCNSPGDCSTGSACTFALCDPQNHMCLDLAEPGCCTNNAQCPNGSAGSACTDEQCDLATNTCTSSPITGCCASNADCTFSSRCSTDTCDLMDHMCVEHSIPGCCMTNADCNDHDVCNPGTCDQQTHECTFTQVPNCCLSNGDCDDHQTCTSDTCDTTTHTCEHAQIPGCCMQNSDCMSGSGCTTGTCDLMTNTCTTTTTPNCCTTDAQCDDNNPCTTDQCDTQTHQCEHTGHCMDAGPSTGDGGNSFELSGGGCTCDSHRTPGGASWLGFVVAVWLVRRRRSARVGAGAIALAITLVVGASPARAQGFDAQFSELATSSSGYLTQQSGTTLARGQLDVGAALDFTNDSVIARNAAGNELMNGGIVGNRLGMQVLGGYGITRWLEVGFAVPLVLAQDGDESLLAATRKLDTTAFGDIRLDGKAAIAEAGDVHFAVAVDVTLPTGSSDDFTGATSASVWPRAIASWQPGAFTAAVDVGFRFQSTSMLQGVSVGNQFTAGAAASYALRPDRVWLLGEAFLGVDTDGGANNVPAEALIGARARVAGPWQAQAAVGGGIGQGVTAPAFEALAAMSYVTPATRHERPRPVADTDHDGIPDDIDRCPTEPEDKDGFQDEDGCPDLDNDNDGIPDALDKCPNDPEDHDGFQDEDGCPDADNDGDGIPDALDQCPNEPEDLDGFQDADGCPDADNDGDGIPDATDQCPNEPETQNGYQDADGCPDELPDEIKKFAGVVQGVAFQSGSADLLPSSAKALDAAVATLQHFPDLRLEIQGHTDDVPMRTGGKYATNDELSQARAESVRSYLAAMGIAPARLIARGYGDSAPREHTYGLNGNALRTARAKNRRVEFQIVIGP